MTWVALAYALAAAGVLALLVGRVLRERRRKRREYGVSLGYTAIVVDGEMVDREDHHVVRVRQAR